VQVNLNDNLLLSKSFDGETAWHNLALRVRKEILETLWGWGTELQVNLKHYILLAIGFEGLTAWHNATLRGNKEILEKLWGWGR
jgi:hypothetical protein